MKRATSKNVKNGREPQAQVNDDKRMYGWLRQQIAIKEEQEQIGLSVLLYRRHVGSEGGSLRTKA